MFSPRYRPMVTLTVSALLLIVQLLFLKVRVIRANAEDINERDNGRQLIGCSAGKYLDTTLQYPRCIACAKGRYSKAGSRGCASCDKGRYAKKSGSSYCVVCEPGKYQDKSGQSYCKSCSSGKYQNLWTQTSSSSCKKCPLGRYNNEYSQR